MPRLSKKEKQEWDFFINPKTGRRTYNKFCRKCHSDCKQNYRAIIVYCRKFKVKRSVITKGDKIALIKNFKLIQEKKLPILAPN